MENKTIFIILTPLAWLFLLIKNLELILNRSDAEQFVPAVNQVFKLGMLAI